MESRHGKLRMNVEGDRLSNLPDDLIHKILSFIDIKDAIKTSILTSKWRYIWTSMPYLNFSTEDFSTLRHFSKFVTHVLSRRNILTEVYSVKLSFRGKVTQMFVKQIMKYAFARNIQQLNVVYLLDEVIDFPLSVFSSQSLKHLSLTMQVNRSRKYLVDRYLTLTWELPALTTLNLHSVTLKVDSADKCIGIFSKCANLKNLTLKEFKITGSDSVSIFHPRLANLTIENSCNYVQVVKVDTPRLENLAFKCSHAELVISAPDLASLLYKASRPLHLSADGFHSLEKADICFLSPQDADAHQIVCLLKLLHNVKFLTLNMEIVELLSAISVGLSFRQPSPFVNLKSLKIYPGNVFCHKQAPGKVTMSTELKSYFLDGSPVSTFTMVSREEIKTQKIMAELRVILEKEKDNTMTKSAHLEQWKPHTAESNKPKLKDAGNMAQINSCWKNLGVQIEKASVITSKLQDIEELVGKLPASKRAKIQPFVSSLCAEAAIAITKITDCVKIQCDENQSLNFKCLLS